MDSTIIIPTHNRGKLLGRCLANLPEGFPAIVVDDGSGTDAYKQIEAACSARANTLLLRHEVPLGACAARNYGAKLATTEWLCFLDDDDTLLPSFFMEMQNVIASHASVNAWLPNIMNCHRHVVRRVRLKELQLTNRAGGCSGFFIRKPLFEEVSGFDARFPSLQDWDLWIRLSLKDELYFSGVLGVIYNTQSSGKITYNLFIKYRGFRRLFVKHRSLWAERNRRLHLIRIWTLRQLLRKDIFGFKNCLSRFLSWPLATLYYLKWRKFR